MTNCIILWTKEWLAISHAASAKVATIADKKFSSAIAVVVILKN
ncbi:hypothetical protein [Halotia branconii]|uniref:Uncharacterized protein n=1 Tax=Halotia branconii CENA392 TaxID=1539056 RepID=A0AAJ6NVT1_9CYAN|nr:hypothetical protein [Halotia branconii]WGV27318.1 hypothetical protein QI031_07460 [Halotia branconii CENA392]